MLWIGAPDTVVLKTSALGFAGAPEADRLRWINAFRRLLDGLDSPIQVVIESEPGAEAEIPKPHRVPIDPRDWRGADISFVDQVARSPSAHRCTVILVTAEAQASRLSAAIREIGIGSTSS